MAPRLLLVLTIVALASGCGATPGATSSPAASATATATAASTPIATVTAPVSVTPSVAPASATAPATDPCTAALTLADVGAGFTADPPRAFPGTGLTGFVSGTQVSLKQTGGSIGSTVACFDSAANAVATYELWGNSCVNANLETIPAQMVSIGPVGGDASKGVFCPGDTSGSSTIYSSTSVYVLVDQLVFSVTVNREEASGPDPTAVATAVGLATRLLAAISG